MPKDRVVHSLYSDGTGQIQYLINGKYYSQNPSLKSEAVAQRWINVRDVLSDMDEEPLELTVKTIIDLLVAIGIPTDTASLFCNAIIQKEHLSLDFAVLPEFVDSGMLATPVIDAMTLQVSRGHRNFRG